MEKEPLVSLNFYPLELQLAHTWTIARGSCQEKKNGLVILTAEGVTGYGEAAFNERHGQTSTLASLAFDRVRKDNRGIIH
jgi:L-alanine-DL-glutamate epimerase-like enolase superfamily enzyme